MHVEHDDAYTLLVQVEGDDELLDQSAGASLRVRIREIDHPDAETTVDAEVVYLHDGDLYVASWFFDGIVRQRVNRDSDPTTTYLTPGDEGYTETTLVPADATVLWTPTVPRTRDGGARPSERE